MGPVSPTTAKAASTSCRPPVALHAACSPARPGPGSTTIDLAVVVERDGCSRLAVVDIDDPWPAPLGPDNGDVGRAQVAPDGRILLSFYPKDDFSRNDIVIIDPDGSWTTLVGHPDRRAGNHVVDGNRVAYTLEEGDWSGVFLTDLDGGEHTRLAAGERDFSSLTWDDDGAEPSRHRHVERQERSRQDRPRRYRRPRRRGRDLGLADADLPRCRRHP